MRSRARCVGLLVAVGMLWASAGQAQAACTISWDGQLSDRWFELDPGPTGSPDDDITNWSPNRYPDFTDDVCFPAGAANQASTRQVTTNTPNAKTITISAGASLTVSDVDLLVHENSVNAGNLIMAGPQNLVISDGDPNDSEGLTNLAGATISFPLGGGSGMRLITGDLLNQGTINVDDPHAGIQASSPAAPATETHTNQGTIAVSLGNTLRVLNSTFVHGSGSVINGGGTVNMASTRLQVSGNSQIVAPTDINLTAGDTIVGTAGAASTGNIDVFGNFAGGGPTRLEGTVPAGITIDADGTTLETNPNADTANAGTINLNGSGAAIQVLSNNVNTATSKLTNAATGTIEFTSGGTAGGRTLSGDIVNQGSILVNHPQASFQAVSTTAPRLANRGSITISAGNNLSVINSILDHGTGGVINGAATGTLSMAFDRFEISGNSQISGADVNLVNGVTLAGTAGSTATGNIDVLGGLAGQGPSALEGTVPAGITIDLDGGTLQSPAVSTTVNAGRINLNSNGSTLQVLSNDPDNSTSKLTNTGTIAFPAGASDGFRFILGWLDNAGTLQVDHPQASFQASGGNTPPSLTNTGTVAVSSGNVLRVIQNTTVTNGAGSVISGAGAVNQDGGRLAITGNGQIGADYNLSGGAALSFSAGSTAGGNVDITSGTTALTGNVPLGMALDIDGGSSTLRSSASFTNAGTINLIGSSALATEDGTPGTTETLTNTGSITSSGSAGVAALSGDLVNQGQITAGHPTTRFDEQLETRAPKLTNTAAGTITVPAGGVLASVPGEAQAVENAGTVLVNGSLAPLGYTQTAGLTTLTTVAPTHSLGIPAGSGVVTLQGGTLRGSGIVNADIVNSGGTVAPGTSPGILTVLRTYAQGAGGTLAVDVSGADPGTGYDQLAVDGTVTLGGTLAINTSGFSPATGQQFKIIDAPAPPAAPTVTGTFTSVQASGGRTYTVGYNATDVTLTADAPPPPPPDTDGDGVPDASDNCPNDQGPASNGGCPVSPPPDTSACDEAHDKLDKAKAKLKRLKAHQASHKAIDKAKAKVKKAKRAVADACG